MKTGLFSPILTLAAAALLLAAGPCFAQDTVNEYLLGPLDVLSVRILESEGSTDLTERTARIGPDGYISLPMIGRLRVADMTIGKLEGILVDHLKAWYKDPAVSVSVVEFRSQPVSVLGSVMNPGVFQLQGRKTLVEVISLAGGLRPEAGSTIKITRKLERGAVPLPGAQDDPTGQFSIGEVNLRSIIEARNPELNIPVQTDDIISVPRADVIYVLGDVDKPGAIVLHDQESLTVMQVISLSGGLLRTANGKEARILRSKPGEPIRTEIALDIKKIYNGKANDLELLPDDILFIPSSVSKKAALRTIEILASAATSALTYNVIRR